MPRPSPWSRFKVQTFARLTALLSDFDLPEFNEWNHLDSATTERTTEVGRGAVREWKLES